MAQATNKAERIAWVIRYVMFPAALAIVLAAVVGGVFVYRDTKMQEFLSGAQSVSDPAKTSEASPATPSLPMPRAVQVNSYAPGREYPLAEWQVVDDAGGFVDAVFVNGELMGMDEIIRVGSGDVIHMTGWAGHRLLGMRFPEVLFSVCGKIVGGVTVSGVRPDVADSVHPNLMHSGWEADLFASDLPRCEEPAISVWGRPPVGWTLRPVIGTWRFIFQASSEIAPVTIIHEESIIRPEDVKKTETQRLSIHHGNTPLHQCANTKCDVVINLAQGPLSAVIVEEMDGWVLLQSAKGSGWVMSSAFRVLP